MAVYIPDGYRSLLNTRQTQIAIKKVKDFFERDLAIQLDLTRVSAPLFVRRRHCACCTSRSTSGGVGLTAAARVISTPLAAVRYRPGLIRSYMPRSGVGSASQML